MVRSSEDKFQVWYVPCPECVAHWIFFDPDAPTYEHRGKPHPPFSAHCPICGPNYRVEITEPLRKGWVTDEERNRLWGLREPRQELSTCRQL
jgi:hypothetical protein